MLLRLSADFTTRESPRSPRHPHDPAPFILGEHKSRSTANFPPPEGLSTCKMRNSWATRTAIRRVGCDRICAGAQSLEKRERAWTNSDRSLNADQRRGGFLSIVQISSI